MIAIHRCWHVSQSSQPLNYSWLRPILSRTAEMDLCCTCNMLARWKTVACTSHTHEHQPLPLLHSWESDISWETFFHCTWSRIVSSFLSACWSQQHEIPRHNTPVCTCLHYSRSWWQWWRLMQVVLKLHTIKLKFNKV